MIVAMALAAAAAFTMPRWYAAKGSLLPPRSDDAGLGIDAMLEGNEMQVIKIPTDVTPADIFVVELESPRFAREIVERFDLKRVYKCRYTPDAIKVLKKHVKFATTTAGTIDMEIEDTSRSRATAMLKAYVEVLDQFNRDLRDAQGRRTRQFVEERLAATKAQLAKSERELTDYQALHREAMITPAISTAAENAARISAQRFALQTRLGVIRSYSRIDSQDERQLEDQIAQLDRQLAALPETGLQIGHLLREVRTYGMINMSLTAQYEDARIKEARNAPIVDLLDVPVAGERKVRPHRLLLVLIGALFGAIVGSAYAAFQPEGLDSPGPRAMAAR
jgi:uncharacterized protein involved in exopolysaccharide biosynthesis